ncbi:helix-turn-helix domain-containing protein [Aquimarina addita]
MKTKLSLLLLFLICYTTSNAQNCISGYVNLENPSDWDTKVNLTQIDITNIDAPDNNTIIASAAIQKNGFFAFDTTTLDTQNQLYRLQVNPISDQKKKEITNTIKNYKVFVLSNNDTIHFKKGNQFFSDFTTNNKAAKEYRALRQFEASQTSFEDTAYTKKQLLATKNYVKDSLQILMVKLIGIKKLEDRNLLTIDIKANPDYYLDLLDELKSSELDPATYVYLEDKLVFLIKEKIEHKYTASLLINFFALFIIAGLVVLFFRSKQKEKNKQSIALSKQENTIKDLIILGKSNKEIANELFISLNTVKTHITNIYSKLNISNRKELLKH